MDPLLDWGIENSLLAAMICVHLTEEALEELGQVVVQMEGPHEIPHRVRYLKDEGNKSFKKGEFALALGLYKHALKLLCFGCMLLREMMTLAITLNLNLAASELKQGQFDNVMTLWSLIPNFKPCHTKALFRRAKAALKLVKELQNFERIHSQSDEKRREVHSQENLNKRVGKRKCLEADPSSEKKGKSTVIGTPIMVGKMRCFLKSESRPSL
ncbi:hypothetical protein Cgig2_006032 [Carnegiea gigantea]|uniref:Uncharacterized protein n=1 Tax=Carnegiea gigantea TaxID=171969 RepID=A0A9Q1KYS8_9CARY|nr:hypothetical protein Cgig2_006032 [Carnegiea gigantea]